MRGTAALATYLIGADVKMSRRAITTATGGAPRWEEHSVAGSRKYNWVGKKERDKERGGRQGASGWKVRGGGLSVRCDELD